MYSRPHPSNLFVLPLYLSDGLVLSGVELDCRGCSKPYRLTSGMGQPGLRGARVALAASSSCPRCGESARFLVLVDAVQRRARVQRVSAAGLWLAQTMIRLGRRGSDDFAAPVLAQEVAPTPEPEVHRALDSVGEFQGQPIPAWITVDGRHMVFEGLLNRGPAGLPRIGRREFAIEPGLLYRQPLDEHV